MAHELLTYDFNPGELQSSGMSEERYTRALQASKFIARVVAVADKQKPDSIPQDIFDRFLANEALYRTTRKIERITYESQFHKRDRKDKKPHTQALSLDMDSFDELIHFRREGTPLRNELVERGYDPDEIFSASWENVEGLHAWHVLNDTHQKYVPNLCRNDLRMIDYMVDRACISPAQPAAG